MKSGQLVTCEPVTAETVIEKGDIVLCKVNGNQYLHLVWGLCGKRFRIGNNKGHENGIIDREHVYGKCVKVED